MTVLTRSQVYQYAAQGGFSGSALDTIVAIAYAESRFNTAAKSPPNFDGSIDRGLYQINSKAHPDVIDSCAYDATCSSKAVFRISNNGTNFNPWTTYTTKDPKISYKQYLTNGPINPGPNNGGNTPNLNNVDIKWLNTSYNKPNAYVTTFQGYGTDTPHWAYDYATPLHTNLTSLVNGTVTVADYKDWGGEVFIKPDANSAAVPGIQGVQLLYYHLDTISVRVGQRVTVGQSIGLSGGQTAGGSHPVRNTGGNIWSTGPHTHVQWFTGFVDVGHNLGYRPKGPDIGPYITWLKSAVATGGVGVPLGGLGGSSGASPLSIPGFSTVLDQVHQTLIGHPGFYGIALTLDEVEQFPGYINLSSSEWDIVGHIRSIGATVTDNFVPFLVRGGIAGLGLLIVTLICIKIILEGVERGIDIAGKFL